MNFFDKVYKAVQQIPRGKVATYGQIACAVGSPRSSRQVGYALHVNPQPGVIPCHRIVNRQGQLASAFVFGGRDVQAMLLLQEGGMVDEEYNVDLTKYQYQGNFNIGE